MSKKAIILGEKESFLVRVLVGKVAAQEIECKYVPFDVDDINANWEGTDVIVLYMDDGCRPDKDVLHFLVDRVEETNLQMIVIGEKIDVGYISDNVPVGVIYKSMVRPINNDEFVETVQEIFKKTEEGEFKKSILIVDDDPSYLGLVREWLREKYKVSMASSGLQAIKWLGKNKADLILLDHEMPVTSGPQVLEMLRSEEETKNIPVMFLTGKSDKESVMSVVALKPEGYFLKTIGKGELIDKLEEFFMVRK